MTKKLSDKVKIARVKGEAERALKQCKENPNKMEVLGYAMATLANIYSILDADKEDERSIAFVAATILAEVTGIQKKEYFPSGGNQLTLPGVKK